MRLGKVIGNVTLSKQEDAYCGGRWKIVSPLDHAQYSKGGDGALSLTYSVIVYDELGAGDGDIVGFVEGAEATAPFDNPIPIDAYNVAIIESLSYKRPA